MRPRRCAAALLWVAGAALAQGSAGSPGAAQPKAVVIDSPAWAELMALPLPPAEAPPFYAADLIDKWGRPVEAQQLRRALLHRHLQLAAGEILSADQRVADVWRQAATQVLSAQTLTAAHDAALNRSLAFEALSELPAGRAAEGMALMGPAAPGWWVDRAGATLAAHLRVRNTGALALAPEQLLLRWPQPALALTLACEAVGPVRPIDPGQATHWWCQALNLQGRAVQALRADQGPALQPAAATWSSTLLQEPARVVRMAQALAGRPPLALADLVRRNTSCQRQGTCPQLALTEQPNSDVALAREQARVAERQRVKEAQARERKALRRHNAVQGLVPLSVLLFGITAYVLLARKVGEGLATLAALAVGPLLAMWLVAGQGQFRDWGGLILFIILLGAGLPVVAVGRVIYKHFFARL